MYSTFFILNEECRIFLFSHELNLTCAKINGHSLSSTISRFLFLCIHVNKIVLNLHLTKIFYQLSKNGSVPLTHEFFLFISNYVLSSINIFCLYLISFSSNSSNKKMLVGILLLLQNHQLKVEKVALPSVCLLINPLVA